VDDVNRSYSCIFHLTVESFILQAIFVLKFAVIHLLSRFLLFGFFAWYVLTTVRLPVRVKSHNLSVAKGLNIIERMTVGLNVDAAYIRS
jgi:hypothetical protein